MPTSRVRFSSKDTYIVLPPPQIQPSPLMEEVLTRPNIPIPLITLDATTKGQPALLDQDIKAMNLDIEGTDLSVRIVAAGQHITMQQFVDELSFVLESPQPSFQGRRPMEFLGSTIRSVSPSKTGLIVSLQ